MNRELLVRQLIEDEGLKLHPYRCPAGKFTVGVGRNIDDKGLTKDECFFLGIKQTTKEGIISFLLEHGITHDDAMYLLDNDIDDVLKDLRKNLGWFDSSPEVVQRVLANMCVNLGINRLLQFKKTLSYLKAGKYAEASVEMLNSKWRNDVGDRAIRLSNILKAQANA